MSKKHRRPPTLKERLTPCIVCLHPLSQRHHLLSFSTYGELSHIGTIQLCANCHDLYHLFERYARKKQKDERLKLFDIETQEEKLIESLATRLEGNLLVRLASIVVAAERLIPQDEETEEDKNTLLKYLTFIANFQRYVDQEHQKRNEWFRNHGAHIFSDIFTQGGDDE